MLEQGVVLHDRYAIQALTREDASGRQYAAHCSVTDKPVVVKQFTPTDIAPTRLGPVFRSLGDAVAHVRHPSLAPVLARFDEGGHGYLVTEPVAGRPLEAVLEAEHVALVQALTWVEELLTLLSVAHGQTPPVLLRAIEPANLRVTDEGHLVLTDVALPGFVHDGPDSPYYLQGRNTTDDTRFDLYSVGAVFYTLLKLAPPPSGGVEPHSRSAPSAAFETLVGSLMSTQAELRPRSAVDALKTLRPFKEKVQKLYGPPSDGEISTSSRRNRDASPQDTRRSLPDSRRILATSVIGDNKPARKPDAAGEDRIEANAPGTSPPVERARVPAATRQVAPKAAPAPRRAAPPAKSVAPPPNDPAPQTVGPPPSRREETRFFIVVVAAVALLCGGIWAFWPAPVPPAETRVATSSSPAAEPSMASSPGAPAEMASSPSAETEPSSSAPRETPSTPVVGTTPSPAPSEGPAGKETPSATPPGEAASDVPRPAAGSAAGGSPAPAASAAPTPAATLITVETTPSNAWVALDGKRVGKSPCQVLLKPREKPYRLDFSKQGYAAATATTRADEKQTVRVSLRALPPPAPVARPQPRPVYSRPAPRPYYRPNPRPPAPAAPPRERIQLPD